MKHILSSTEESRGALGAGLPGSGIAPSMSD